MSKPLFVKLGVICLIALLLNVPLAMINDKAEERNRYQQTASHSIGRSWTGSQLLIGPIIRIPYTTETVEKTWDKNLKNYKHITVAKNHHYWVVPDSINIDANIDNDIRYKGIYEVLVYSSHMGIKGKLPVDMLAELKTMEDVKSVGTPVMSFAVSDSRGINSIPKLMLGNKEINFKPGSQLEFNTSGMHVELDEKLLKQATDFSFTLDLRGMHWLEFVPVAKEATISAQSNWPHPSFTGEFLPAIRNISEVGYQAQWKVTSFATNIEEKLRKCSIGDCKRIAGTSFGVSHMQPVDIYLQTERSIKYGFLFIMLSFVAFFCFEILKGMSIHGVQYTLVGFSMAVFYLLLLALSEHIAFVWAYVIATACCVLLLHVYLKAVMQSHKKAGAFSAAFILLYTLLYFIIRSEDFALLMGSVLTFAVLAAVMLSTRNVDWGQVGNKLASLKPEKNLDEKDMQEDLEFV